MTEVADALGRYVMEFERVDGAQSGRPAWLKRRREHAMGRFQSLGFPTTADEEWRFTSVAPIAGMRFALAADGASTRSEPADWAPFRLTDVASAEIVFVNGRYSAERSTVRALPRGVRVESLASVLASDPGHVEPYLTRVAGFERHAFTALNTAFLVDGALVSVPREAILDGPIHVLFVSASGAVVDGTARSELVEGTMAHPRVLVVAGEGSQVSIVESYVGPENDRSFTNAVCEIVLGENAVVDHYKVQRESLQGYHVGTMHVLARRNANFSSHSMSLGGLLVRNEIVAVLDGDGIECTLNGLYLGDEQRLVDNHTTIDHARPHCDSREIYRGILADHARAVFNGKIIVRPDAQKTDAKQTNKALLLSEDAQINTTPQLEIFADDVKCTHGAAVGQMDDEAIFYLRARGLSHQEACNLLIRAFAGDVLTRMRFEPLRTRVEAELLRQLPGAAAA